MSTKYLRIILGILFFAYLASFIYNRFIDPNPGLSRNSDQLLNDDGLLPEELGKISWLRNYSRALSLSGVHERPVLIFFEEIPGDFEAKSNGINILRDPFLCEMIESKYIPVVVYRNGDSNDRQLMDLMVEFIDGEGTLRITNEKASEIRTRILLNEGLSGVFSQLMAEICLDSCENYLQNYSRELSSPDSLRPKEILHPELKFLPLSPLQSQTISRLIEEKKEFKHLLSPRQVSMLEIIKNHPEIEWESVSEKSFSDAWWSLVAKAEQNKIL